MALIRVFQWAIDKQRHHLRGTTAVELARVSEGLPQPHRSVLEVGVMEEEEQLARVLPLCHAGALNPAAHPLMEDIPTLEVLEVTAASWTGPSIPTTPTTTDPTTRDMQIAMTHCSLK